MIDYMEIWKEIKGYEGLYEVSSEGRVRSKDRWVDNGKGLYLKKGRLLKQGKTGCGYPKVSLYGNVRKDLMIHRLVAEAFIPNPDNLPCIDHINTIVTDCRIENLRWVSHSGNNHNPITLERQKKSHTGKKHNPESIKKIAAFRKGMHWKQIEGKRIWF